MPRTKIDLSNRIQNHGNLIATLAFVSTSLQLIESDETMKGHSTTLESPFDKFYYGESRYADSRLISPFETSQRFTAIVIPESINPSEATFFSEEDLDNFDLVLRPKYTKEIKIRVKAMRIDKSLPKIFID